MASRSQRSARAKLTERTAGRLRKWALGAAAVAGTAAIAWGVTNLLDKGAEAVKGSAPIALHVDTRLAVIYAGLPPWQSYGFVVRRTGSLPSPPSALCREWQDWAYGRGGVDAEQTRLQIQLQGRANTAILIDRVEVDVERRDKPLAGTLGYCAARGGAVASPRQVDINLDTSPPTVLFAMTGDDYPSRHRLPLTLTGSETELLEIKAHTRRCDCRWRAKLHMIVDGERYVAVIPNEGEPFRTTASVAARHLTWTGDRWRSMTRGEWKGTLPMNWARLAGNVTP